MLVQGFYNDFGDPPSGLKVPYLTQRLTSANDGVNSAP